MVLKSVWEKISCWITIDWQKCLHLHLYCLPAIRIVLEINWFCHWCWWKSISIIYPSWNNIISCKEWERQGKMKENLLFLPDLNRLEICKFFYFHKFTHFFLINNGHNSSCQQFIKNGKKLDSICDLFSEFNIFLPLHLFYISTWLNWTKFTIKLNQNLYRKRQPKK